MATRYVFKKRWKHCLAGAFDFFGSLLTFFLPRKFKLHPERLRKVLVLRVDHLGDALLARPALFRLRRALPDAQIHVLTAAENASVFQLDAFIDRVIPFSDHWFQKEISFGRKWLAFWQVCAALRSNGYDAAVDLRGDLRANLLMFCAGIPIRFGYGVTGGGWMLTHEKSPDVHLHQVLLNLNLIREWGVESAEAENSRVRYPASSKTWLEKNFPRPSKSYAVLHPSAGNPQKEWPWTSFQVLCSGLLNAGVQSIFIIGTAEERKKNPLPASDQITDVRGDTDLHELACLLENAALFIGNDSGPAHVAAAQGCPVLLIASGTNQIECWHPWTSRLTVIQSTAEAPASVEQVLNSAKNLLEPS